MSIIKNKNSSLLFLFKGSFILISLPILMIISLLQLIKSNEFLKEKSKRNLDESNFFYNCHNPNIEFFPRQNKFLLDSESIDDRGTKSLNFQKLERLDFNYFKNSERSVTEFFKDKMYNTKILGEKRIGNNVFYMIHTKLKMTNINKFTLNLVAFDLNGKQTFSAIKEFHINEILVNAQIQLIKIPKADSAKASVTKGILVCYKARIPNTDTFKIYFHIIDSNGIPNFINLTENFISGPYPVKIFRKDYIFSDTGSENYLYFDGLINDQWKIYEIKFTYQYKFSENKYFWQMKRKATNYIFYITKSYIKNAFYWDIRFVRRLNDKRDALMKDYYLLYKKNDYIEILVRSLENPTYKSITIKEKFVEYNNEKENFYIRPIRLHSLKYSNDDRIIICYKQSETSSTIDHKHNIYCRILTRQGKSYSNEILLYSKDLIENTDDITKPFNFATKMDNDYNLNFAFENYGKNSNSNYPCSLSKFNLKNYIESLNFGNNYFPIDLASSDKKLFWYVKSDKLVMEVLNIRNRNIIEKGDKYELEIEFKNNKHSDRNIFITQIFIEDKNYDYNLKEIIAVLFSKGEKKSDKVLFFFDVQKKIKTTLNLDMKNMLTPDFNSVEFTSNNKGQLLYVEKKYDNRRLKIDLILRDKNYDSFYKEEEKSFSIKGNIEPAYCYNDEGFFILYMKNKKSRPNFYYYSTKEEENDAEVFKDSEKKEDQPHSEFTCSKIGETKEIAYIFNRQNNNDHEIRAKFIESRGRIFIVAKEPNVSYFNIRAKEINNGIAIIYVKKDHRKNGLQTIEYVIVDKMSHFDNENSEDFDYEKKRKTLVYDINPQYSLEFKIVKTLNNQEIVITYSVDDPNGKRHIYYVIIEQCSKDEYLDNNKNCAKCMSGCSNCMQQRECLWCKDGFSLTNSKICKQCSSNCKKCDQNLFCKECLSGYSLAHLATNDFRCIQKSIIEKQYYFNVESNYYERCDSRCTNGCINTSTSCISISCPNNQAKKEGNCVDINKENNPGYYLTTENGIQIYKKCDNHCATCSDNIKCDTCKTSLIKIPITEELNCLSREEITNKYFVDEDGKYKKCPRGCKGCKEYKKNLVCIGCDNDIKFYNVRGLTNTCLEKIEENYSYFYFNEKDKIFDRCLIGCEKCNNGEECLTCRENNEYYKFTTSDGKYVCNKSPFDGYYINKQADGTKYWEKCNEKCKTCEKDKGYQCVLCNNDKEYYKLITTSNILKCYKTDHRDVKNYYLDKGAKEFKKCEENCETCEEAKKCLTCKDPEKAVVSDTGLCHDKKTPIINYYFDGVKNIFKRCRIPCKKCRNDTDDKCFECYNEKGYYELPYENKNQNKEIPSKICWYKSRSKEGFYFDYVDRKFKYCHADCQICIEADKCTKCKKANYALKSNTGKCADINVEIDNYYYDPTTKRFLDCDRACKKCKDNTIKCNECEENYMKNAKGECLSTIPDGHYYDKDKKEIKECGESCRLCIDRADKCLECNSAKNYFPIYYEKDGKLKKETCYNSKPGSFPKEFIFNKDKNYFEPCSETCLTCKDEKTKCTSCNRAKNYFPIYYEKKNKLKKETCYNKNPGRFPKNFIFNNTQNYFEPCDDSCETCQDKKYKCLECNTSRNYFPIFYEKENKLKKETCYNNKPGSFPKNYIFNNTQNYFEPCDDSCKTCQDEKYKCLECNKDYAHIEIPQKVDPDPYTIFKSRCFNISSEFYYDKLRGENISIFYDSENKILKKCHNTCETCSDIDKCKKCKQNFYKYDILVDKFFNRDKDLCHKEKPGYYLKKQNDTFVLAECKPNCHICSSFDKCEECRNGYFFDEEKEECKEDKYKNNKYYIETEIESMEDIVKVRGQEALINMVIKNKPTEEKITFLSKMVESKKKITPLDKIKNNIIVNDVIYKQKFDTNSTKEVEELQGKNIDALKNIFENKTLIDGLLNKTSKDYNKNVLTLGYTIFKSSINSEYIPYDKFKTINEMALNYNKNPKILFREKKIDNSDKQFMDIEAENDLLNIGTKTSSNLISVIKYGTDKIMNDTNANPCNKLNILPINLEIHSLVVNENSKILRNSVNDNLQNMVSLKTFSSDFNREHFNDTLIYEDSIYSDNTFTSTKKFDKSFFDNNSTKNQLRRLFKKNAIIKSLQNDIGAYDPEFFTSTKKRYLSQKHMDTIKLNNIYNMNMTINVPIEYLITEYNKNISTYGLVLYNEYPLLSPNNKNFSENVISLKFFDKNAKEVPIKNLKTPIDFIFPKSEKLKKFNNCTFLNDQSLKWDVEGCSTKSTEKYIVCSCIHLTDFSLAAYNPVKIFEDVIFLIMDMWIINEFKSFEYLNFSNAIAIYIFVGIFIMFLCGLKTAILHDYRIEQDQNCNAYYHFTDKKYELCSNKQLYDELYELREITDGSELTAFAHILEVLDNNFTFSDDKIQYEKSESYNKKDLKRKGSSIEMSEISITKNINNSQEHLVNNDNNDNNEKNKNRKRNSSHIIEIDSSTNMFTRGISNASIDENYISRSDSNNFDENNLDINNNLNIENDIESQKELERERQKEREKDNEKVVIKKRNKIKLRREIKETLHDDEKLKHTAFSKKNNYREFLLKLLYLENEDIRILIKDYFVIDKKLTFEKIEEYLAEKKIINLDLNENNQNNNEITNDSETKNSNENIDNELKISDNEDEENKKNQKEKLTENKEDDCLNDLDPYLNQPEIYKCIWLKYSIWHKFKNLIGNCFSMEYTVFNIFKFNLTEQISKLNFWILFCSRIASSLIISSILSSTGGTDDENTSSSGHVYSNRELATSIVTVLINDILFNFIEGLLKKKDIDEQKYLEKPMIKRQRAKNYQKIVHIILLIYFIFGCVNTTWITMKYVALGRENEIYSEFFVSNFMDFFIKDVILIVLKSIVYFVVIWDYKEPFSNISCFKRLLIIFLSFAAWFFKFFDF